MIEEQTLSAVILSSASSPKDGRKLRSGSISTSISGQTSRKAQEDCELQSELSLFEDL
jgi:hypothetical protein